MKQVLLTRDGVAVLDVPAPGVEPGAILVQVTQSCISVGTEMSGVRASDTPLWKRALQRPDQLRRVAQMTLKEGVGAVRTAVNTKLSEAFPIGYSAAGRVLAVGDSVVDFAPDDRVACAGARNAYHAEVICVPRNLCVRIPDAVSDQDAATVTLGAIALQGVRRVEPTLGETIVVIGLGSIGQLTVQLLKSAGSRVIGIDLDEKRLAEARACGLDVGLRPGGDDGEIAQVQRLTDGYGADGVIVTAASPSDEIISSAFRMCRRKARVVLVGDVGLDLKREDIYAKELDLRVSTSYGPGRYDRNYEEEGLDYPIGYVRWTENRNMAEYLRQLADGRVRIAADAKTSFPLDHAAEAYRSLAEGAGRPVFAFYDYGVASGVPARRVVERRAAVANSGKVRLALIGTGAFAKTMHLPLLAKLSDRFEIGAFVSRRGHEADALARQYSARLVATDPAAVFDDPGIDAVLISTRHDSHAALTMAALRKGKHVFVEKPLCLTEAELTEIEALAGQLGDTSPVLMTGFNRRFAPQVAEMKAALDSRSNPFVLNYRVNAGYLPLDHWVHGVEGGGRNIGEACHFYDLIGYLAGAPVLKVEAKAIAPATAHYARNDNFIATLTFADGSVASVTYTALGHSEQPKEQIEIFYDGKILKLVDFHQLVASGAGIKPSTSSPPDKGHRSELAAFGDAAAGRAPWPISLDQQAQAMRIAFAVEAAISGQ